MATMQPRAPDEIGYRPEIDGLRAIAVAGVVLYHAGIGGAGFVGVDIFFVISGYLITSILLREWRTAGKLDLLAFYARRVRRIVPAATMVVISTLVVSAVLLSPDELTRVANSAGAAAMFCANIYFQLTTGNYFDASEEGMPLLHLWSLSVEEQFYLLWPAILVGILRYRPQALLPLLCGLGFASLVVAEWLIRTNPAAAFYQTPARFWELAVGGIIAVLPARVLPRHAAPAGILLAIAACAYPLDHFPGIGALPAVAGASLLIAAVHGGANNAILRSRPLVGIGLISYSLYLWHWPLLAMYRATIVGEGSMQARLLLCAVAVLLAIASYRYIEQPFRRLKFSKGRVVGAGLVLSITLGVCSITIAGAFESVPYVPDTPASRASNDTPKEFIARCAYWPMESLAAFPKKGCTPDAQTRMILWGDSMAISWQPMVAAIDSHAASYTRAGCPPFLDYRVAFRAKFIRELCVGFNAKVIATMGSADTLVLAAHWEIYQGIDTAFSATLAQVAPHFRRIILIGETPTMHDSASHCLELGRVDACGVSRREFDAVKEPIRKKLLAIAAAYPQVEYLDPADFFCSREFCPLMKDGYSLYTDSHHVSVRAATAFSAEYLNGIRRSGALGAGKNMSDRRPGLLPR
jgi:peptidoglycan/LPS O-acetylase OafA/YrhL